MLAAGAQAQHVVHGTLSDAETGEALPAANIVVEGTYHGTITNRDGEFQLGVERFPATLLFRYIGYESQRLTVEADSDLPLDVRLQPVSYIMPEIVVTDENPALGIMRCVIEGKQVWRAALRSYSADAYTRFAVSNDTGIVSISESLSEVFWDQERGTREVIKSQRQTSNLNLSTYLPAAQFVANLYDDEIELAGYTFVGVTHPRAFGTYRFRLEGTRMLDDQLVYDIAVEPRNRLKTAFRGSIAVLADECALLEVALEPGQAFLFPPPLKRLEMTFFQQYSTFGASAWLPVDFRSDIVVEVSLGFLMSFPTVHVKQVSRLTGYSVNAVAPDSLYEAEDYLLVDTEAVEADTLLEEEGIAVPLDTLERMAYRTIDSTMTLDKTFEPGGVLGRAVARQNRGDDPADDGSRIGSLVDRLSLEPLLRFNRVEAFYGGLSAGHAFGRLRVHGGGGWSSARGPDDWSYQLGAEVRLGRNENGSVQAGYARGVEPRYRSRLYGAPVAALYSLSGGGDYFDYLHNERWTLRARRGFERYEISVGLHHESPSSVNSATAYDLVGHPDEPRVNPAVSSDILRSVSGALQIGDDDNTLGFTARRYARVEIEHGAASNRFTRLGIEAEWRMETFFRRRMLPNTLDLHLSAGTAWGRLPIHRLGIIEGSLGVYRPFGALRTRTGRPYQGDRYVGLTWEHSFRTVPFELLGLQALARRGFGVILTGGHARSAHSSRPQGTEAKALFEAADSFHHEIGLAVSGLFGILRIDLATRLDAPAVTLGVSAARIF